MPTRDIHLASRDITVPATAPAAVHRLPLRVN
jgi:hypothetical protein